MSSVQSTPSHLKGGGEWILFSSEDAQNTLEMTGLLHGLRCKTQGLTSVVPSSPCTQLCTERQHCWGAGGALESRHCELRARKEYLDLLVTKQRVWKQGWPGTEVELGWM